MRIRHFGFLANRAKARDLPLCRRLLGLPADAPKPQPACAREQLRRLTGRDLDQCPSCKTGAMALVAELPKLSVPLFSFAPAPRLDSS